MVLFYIEYIIEYHNELIKFLKENSESDDIIVIKTIDIIKFELFDLMKTNKAVISHVSNIKSIYDYDIKKICVIQDGYKVSISKCAVPEGDLSMKIDRDKLDYICHRCEIMAEIELMLPTCYSLEYAKQNLFKRG